MKKIHLMLFSLALFYFEIKAQAPASFELKEGMKLHYLIENNFLFTVELHQLADEVVFTWYDDGEKGAQITLTENAMNNVYDQLNYIYGVVGLSPQTYNTATSIFCSRKLYSELKLKGKAVYFPYESTWDGEKTPVTLVKKGEEMKMTVNIENGGTATLPFYHFVSEEKETISVLDNERYPLIIEMALDFHIKLNSIEMP